MTTFNQPYIRDDLTIDDKVQKYYDSCTVMGRCCCWAGSSSTRPPCGCTASR